MAQGERSPAILVRFDDVNRRTGLVLRQPSSDAAGIAGVTLFSRQWARRGGTRGDL